MYTPFKMSQDTKLSVDFIEKIIKQEIKVFFDYLIQEKLVEEKNSEFENIFGMFREKDFGADKYRDEYNILRTELDGLHRQTKVKAYHIFSKNQRPILKNIYPDLTSREITKKISEIWKTLDPDQKSQYRPFGSSKK